MHAHPIPIARHRIEVPGMLVVRPDAIGSSEVLECGTTRASSWAQKCGPPVGKEASVVGTLRRPDEQRAYQSMVPNEGYMLQIQNTGQCVEVRLYRALGYFVDHHPETPNIPTLVRQKVFRSF